ncbi:dienelactone hydrolase family protein [Arsenicicoccus piscis]|uniref:Dienelactone hydrolase domain-containing protein n=1 Tax=Arsenicicoccus piscis TaxID=673954 RepID=A0ABQ6HNX0_9MICO|nr:dienelactone hydrolase family protein [Arsenicicoccus piscis]MCH8628842.1 dienelactone hydrolase family protein [Arsenicicoccus piscis]GMA20106.1 hypothetical protein GCM10025862_21270 [Arsenicicoccus piscis]
MAIITVLPSLLGMRTGVLDFADRIRSAGHDVRFVDYLDGQTFDSIETARAHRDEVGAATLMARARELAKDIPDGFIPAGFSSGVGAAQGLALSRPVRGMIAVVGGGQLSEFGKDWPADTPVQYHLMADDPYVDPSAVEREAVAIRSAGSPAEVFHYSGGGHLFFDRTLPQDYDRQATDEMMSRVLEFVETID